MKNKTRKNTTAFSFTVFSSIINKPGVSSLRNDHRDDVNCLDFKRNLAHFRAFVILHELNTWMWSRDAFIMYGIITRDEGISFSLVFFMKIFFSITLPLFKGLAFKNNHSYYYTTSQSGNSKTHRETEKTTLESTKKFYKASLIFKGDLKSCHFSATSWLVLSSSSHNKQ